MYERYGVYCFYSSIFIFYSTKIRIIHVMYTAAFVTWPQKVRRKAPPLLVRVHTLEDIKSVSPVKAISKSSRDHILICGENTFYLLYCLSLVQLTLLWGLNMIFDFCTFEIVILIISALTLNSYGIRIILEDIETI
jgi:hypothetical protein